MRSLLLVGQKSKHIIVIWPGWKSVPGPFVCKPVINFKLLSDECGGYGNSHRHRNYVHGSSTGNRRLGLHNEAVGDTG